MKSQSVRKIRTDTDECTYCTDKMATDHIMQEGLIYEEKVGMANNHTSPGQAVW